VNYSVCSCIATQPSSTLPAGIGHELRGVPLYEYSWGSPRIVNVNESLTDRFCSVLHLHC